MRHITNIRVIHETSRDQFGGEVGEMNSRLNLGACDWGSARGWAMWRTEERTTAIPLGCISPSGMRRLMLVLLYVACAVAEAQQAVLYFEPQRGRPAVPEIKAAPPIRLLDKTDKGATFECSASWCWTAPVRLKGEDYSSLELPGGGLQGEIGEPQIPCYGTFVEVPDGATVRLKVDEALWTQLEGRFTIVPRQPPPADKIGARTPPFTKSGPAYQRDEFLPTQPVRIADRMRIRQKSLVYVTFTPISYNSARGMLKAARKVGWHLEFEFPQGRPATPKPWSDRMGARIHTVF